MLKRRSVGHSFPVIMYRRSWNGILKDHSAGIQSEIHSKEIKNPSQNNFQEGFTVLRTGIEPVRTFLSTGF